MPPRSRSRVQAQTQTTGKSREIAGICLLGLGVFCGLSLISFHAGSGTMMGPGGRATASGLYSMAGAGAYLLVAALLVVAVRVFRGLAWHSSFSELSGIVGFLAGSTVLLHLAFAGATADLVGPGGAMGQWLSDHVAGFLGTVGAGLVASIVLLISSMVLTSVSLSEASGVVLWVGQQSVRALVTTGRGIGRLGRAMFPEKTDRELLHAADNLFDPNDVEQDRQGDQDQDQDDGEPDFGDDLRDKLLDLSDPVEDPEDTLTMSPEELSQLRHRERTLRGIPAHPLPPAPRPNEPRPAPPMLHALPPMESAAVLVAKGDRTIDLELDDLSILMPDDDPLAEDDAYYAELRADRVAPRRAPSRTPGRRPVSALIAEVAAVECAAPPAPPEVPRAAAAVALAPPIREKASAPPVIVTPVDQPEARAIARATEAAAAAAADRAARREEGPGFIRLSEGDFVLPPAGPAGLRAAARPGDRQEGAVRHGRPPRAGDGQLRGQGERQRHQHGPGGDHVRVRARARHPHRQDRPARERPGDGPRGPGGPHRRPHPRQGGGRRRGAQQEPPDGLPEGDPGRGRRFRGATAQAADRPRQGHQGQSRQRQPGQDAPPAGGRHHRLGQVGHRQRDDHQHPLQRHPRRGALHHGRPQDAGAVDLRGHPAPAACRW